MRSCRGAGRGRPQRRIVCASEVEEAAADRLLDRVDPPLTLGIHRLPIRRAIAPSDIRLTPRLVGAIRELNPDVLHAHGLRGGVTGRMVGTILRASGLRVARIYTPHGGTLSLDPRTAHGRLARALERVLARMTDAFVFTSRDEAETFAARVARPRVPTAVAPNGLRSDDFMPVRRAADARDFVFIGEIGGPESADVFLKALALMGDRSRRVPTAFVVGHGPERMRCAALATDLGARCQRILPRSGGGAHRIPPRPRHGHPVAG